METEAHLSSYLKTFRNRDTLYQIIRVGFVGGFNTVVYFALLNLFLNPFGNFRAVTAAYVLATSLSYVMNRRWSFQIADGSVGSAKESAGFFLVNLIAWGLTIVVTQVADGVWGPLTRLEVNLASVLATGLIVLPKFAAYRDIVFKKSLSAGPLGDEQEAGRHAHRSPSDIESDRSAPRSR